MAYIIVSAIIVGIFYLRRRFLDYAGGRDRRAEYAGWVADFERRHEEDMRRLAGIECRDALRWLSRNR